VLCFFIFAGAIQAAAAQTGAEDLSAVSYYVRASGDDRNDGLSEAAPFKTLGRALDAAKSGAVRTITVIGELNETSEGPAGFIRDRESVFFIGNSGNEEILIRGLDHRAGLNAEGSGKQVIMIEGGSVIRLEHIVVTGGRAENGGGIYIDGAALTLGDGAQVRGNRAEADGGGVYTTGDGFIHSGAAEIRGNTPDDVKRE
jgi:hypothetical protein